MYLKWNQNLTRVWVQVNKFSSSNSNFSFVCLLITKTKKKTILFVSAFSSRSLLAEDIPIKNRTDLFLFPISNFYFIFRFFLTIPLNLEYFSSRQLKNIYFLDLHMDICHWIYAYFFPKINLSRPF